jgi:hypothetical protein
MGESNDCEIEKKDVAPSTVSEAATPTAASIAANLLSPTTERAIEDLQMQNNAFRAAAEQQEKDKETTNTALTVPNLNGKEMSGFGEPNNANKQVANGDFDNLQKAVQMLGRAKHLDDAKQFDEALKMYRQGVDMLLEELMVRQGTDQSRSYLRNKCNDFMNRIDQLKLIIQIENAKKNKEIAENNQNNKGLNNQSN